MTKAERDAINRAKMAKYYDLKPLLEAGSRAAHEQAHWAEVRKANKARGAK